MIPVCLYFQVHQPYRLKRYNYFDVGRDHRYFDDAANREILRRVAEKCYLPATAMCERLLARHPRFAVSFSLSGCLLEQLRAWAPEALAAFRRLSRTGRVEFLAETSHHSLAWLASPEEFEAQVALHRRLVLEELEQEPRVFRNTELIYDDALAAFLAARGYRGVLADGVAPLLGTRSPDHVYRSAGEPGLPLLLRNHRLSDDVAFRFSNREWSEWPLTPARYDRWIRGLQGDVVSLFMDFETFGEHQWKETGIFEFFESWVDLRLSRRGVAFLTPSEAIAILPPIETRSRRPARSRGPTRRGTSRRGRATISRRTRCRSSSPSRPASGSPARRTCCATSGCSRARTTSTTWRPKRPATAKCTTYFSPFESAYDAYMTYMHVVSDLERRLPRAAARTRSAAREPVRPAPRA